MMQNERGEVRRREDRGEGRMAGEREMKEEEEQAREWREGKQVGMENEGAREEAGEEGKQ